MGWKGDDLDFQHCYVLQGYWLLCFHFLKRLWYLSLNVKFIKGDAKHMLKINIFGLANFK